MYRPPFLTLKRGPGVHVAKEETLHLRLFLRGGGGGVCTQATGVSIKEIVETKYFLLQIQTLMIMIVVRITNYNAALLQVVITNPYLFICLFICVVCRTP